MSANLPIPPTWLPYLKRLAIAAIVILLLWRLQQTVQLLAISAFLAGAITPLVLEMEKYHLKRGWAVAIIYLGILIVLLLTVAPAPRLIYELGQFLIKLPELVRQIQYPDLGFFGISPQDLRIFFQSDAITAQLQNLGREVAGQTRDLAGQTVNFTLQLLNVLSLGLLSLLITAYMVINSEELLTKVLSPFKPELRLQVRELLPPINRCLGAYVLGRIGTSALLGFCTYLVLVTVGVQFAGALGLVVAVSNLIPFVGPILGLIPMMLTAASLGIGVVILVAGTSFVLQQIEAWILQPWLVGPYLNLDPFELLLSIIVGAELLGVVGAIIAPPIAGIGKIIFAYYRHHQVLEQEQQD
ncbi:MAG: AI-2E family transporter [Pseudanabaenaceae cyanobacterium bins.68]|nr:AI-2E family transporter [Pseudanabaenaceae cyanobacterium bins.68]